MNFIVHGISGRMGQRIANIGVLKGFRLVGAVCGPNEPFVGRNISCIVEDCENVQDGLIIVEDIDKLDGVVADVVIDFSFAGVSVKVAQFCGRNRIALVQGTTGLDS